MVGVVSLEFVDVMAEAASNVDNQRRIGRSIGTGEQFLFYRIDLGMMPRQAALSVTAHYG